MIGPRFPVLVSIVGSIAATFLPPPAAADEGAESRAAIERLTGEERDALRDRHAAFLALPAAERERLRSLRERLQADAETGEYGGTLNQTLDRLRDVLAALPPEHRVLIDAAESPQARAEALRRVLADRRRIPLPPAGGGEEAKREAFRTLKGVLEEPDRPRLRDPRRAAIVAEAFALLTDRAAPSVPGVYDIGPRHERLMAVLDATAGRTGADSRRSERWLSDGLLRDLAARVAARGYPGLDAWLVDDRRGVLRFVLAEELGRELGRAWVAHIGGPDGERLFELLSSVPEDEAARIAADGNPEFRLARRLAGLGWPEPEPLPEGVEPPPDLPAVREAMGLAGKLIFGPGGPGRGGPGPGGPGRGGQGRGGLGRGGPDGSPPGPPGGGAD